MGDVMDKATVNWLGEKYPPTGPRPSHLKDVLTDLHVLEREKDGAGKDIPMPTLWGGTPPSLQVITAGGTSIAKWWTGLAGVGLGGGALVQGLKGANLWPGSDDLSDLQRAVLTGSAAVMAAAAVIAIAIIVKADVSGRAVASAAEYRARAAIATALVQSFQYEAASPAPVGPEPKHIIRTTGQQWKTVTQFEWNDGALVARVDGTTTVPVDEIAWITPSGVWNGTS
jgi:hypothetical protein